MDNNFDKVILWSKNTLSFKRVQEIQKENKEKIYSIVEDFKLKNPKVKFVICGSSSLILQNQLAKKYVKDVDLYILKGKVIDKPELVDIISANIFPIGWKKRIVDVGGYKVMSTFDIACTMACSYWKPWKPDRKIILLWLLRDINLEELKMTIRKTIKYRIRVNKSDIQCFSEFEKKFTQRYIDLNKNSDKGLIKLLKEDEK